MENYTSHRQYLIFNSKKSKDLDFQVVCRGLFKVQWFNVRDDCSFCWYCWNCRPSMFKLSFHNNCNINVTLDRFKDTKRVNRRRRRTEIHFTWPKFHFLPYICLLVPVYTLPVSFNTYSSNKLLSGWYTWSSRIHNIAYWSVWLSLVRSK